MKINKIKCDICGDLVDYNNVSVKPNGEWPDVEDVQRFKINKITLNGVEEPSIDLFKPTYIHMEYDLCEKCLIRFHVLINKIKNEGDGI